MNKENKVLLIFPPVWLPDVPFLSTPTLTAFLKQKAINVEQIDLNIAFWNYLYSISFITRLHSKIQNKLSVFFKKKHISLKEKNIIKKIAVIGKLPTKQFIEEVQQRVISYEIYLELVGIFSEFRISDSIKKNLTAKLKEDHQDYHDFYFSTISYSIFSYSIIDLQNIVEQKGNPYLDYFRSYSINSIIKKQPKIIGISITANNQVVPAFTLAKTIKNYLSNCMIVIGGSWCSLVNKNLGYKLQLFPYIDYMIVNEGEKPLLRLVNTIINKTDIKKTKGVYYKLGTSVEFNGISENVKMSELPRPDFYGLNLNNYFQKTTLPIQNSRGCYWGKCIFCSYPVLEPSYKQRGVNLIMDDIINLQNINNTRVFSFVDSLISPAFADNFSKLIIKKKLTLEWVMFARFESQFTKDLLYRMGKSGCTTICWGLESGNQQVLNEIKKNIDLPIVQEILENAANAGIHNRVLVMYGLPSEQLNEAYDTINFVKNNIHNIHSLAYNYYYPEKNTPIEDYSVRNGIKLTSQPENDLSLGYEWKNQMDSKSIDVISNEYRMLDNLISNRNNNSIITSHLLSLIKENDLIKVTVPYGNDELLMISIVGEDGDGKLKRYFFEIQN